MNTPMAGLVAAAAAVQGAWRVSDPGEFTDEQLLATNTALGVLRRRTEAAQAQIAAQLAARSRPGSGPESLARKTGHTSVVDLISTTTGATTGEAMRLVKVGQATAPRPTFGDTPAPPAHPAVGVAVAADRLPVAAAEQIIRLLDRLPASIPADRKTQAEERLVAKLSGLPSDRWHRILVEAHAALDPEGLARREAEVHARRYLRIWEKDQAVHFEGAADAATAAPLVTVLDALVTTSFRTSTDTSGSAADTADTGNVGSSVDADHDGDPGDGTRTDSTGADGTGAAGDTADAAVAAAMLDERTVAQRRLDALMILCRHYLDCAHTGEPTGGATVIVRVNMDDLQEGTGTGTIDGLDQPISIDTIRRIGGTGPVIPMYLGPNKEVLDLGRSQRLFTPAQKLVLYERDGGCAFCGAPPGHTRAHHIYWWARDKGRTDLANGILLCETCHHRIHDNGWDIRIDPAPGARRNATTGPGAHVWFIPPARIDPTRTPRLGGRARHEYAA
ncbi:DUF222 domain-containing protein [Microbacterium horticulturae]|uniref:DUF222 domain-containing protein n=1 Tax=Microbacterium horticulturae TaxID=3028316 RepID=A0ABY8BYQ2_9MICO|nr:HNH endonuclease signature motif containing protein [Microbacterium sp. KACC 23027]WEG09050.1 DUF222 domain-containing protein [Microbacterium sp. KACC 23027]